MTDTVEMLVGRLGMPEIGGSYFTFSNENNDLIWGFLAECHRRGWLYKGHDTMPWCARCGTGLSQMEMNEGYQDREDPGLTVRFPLVDRPGEALLVWTTTPWTLTSNVAAAVGPRPALRPVRQGDDVVLARARARSRPRSTGRSRSWRSAPAASSSAGATTGRSTTCRRSGTAFAEAGYEHRVVAWDEVGEDEGTGIVHIAPGCGAEDFQLGKALGLPVIAPIDEDGIYLDGFGSLSGRDVRDVAEPIVEHLERRGRFYHLEPYIHRYPHCWRCGTPLVFRLVDEWFISMGPVYDQPRETLTKEQVDASLRYQIMEVVDQIRWIPDFGYERELDWLRNMHDWMISKKRYWGLALPIYDCAACGTVEVIGGREELRERAVEGWDRFEGHTPHRPWVDEVRIACPNCGAPVERIKDVGNPWLDAGIVPFSTLHYREDPEYWAQWFPADFITESFPGQFRNWFYSMLAMSTVLKPRGAVQDDLRLRPRVRRGRPADAQELGQRDRVRRGRRADGRRRHALDVRQGPAGGEHPVRLARGRRGAPRAAGAVERLRVLRDVRAAGRLDAGRGARRRRRRAAGARPLDPVARGRRRPRSSRSGCATSTRSARRGPCRAFIDDLSTWYLRLSRDRMRPRPTTPRTATAAFATLHAALVATTPDARADPAVPGRDDVPEPRRDASTTPRPDSVHLTRWPTAELAAPPRRRLERSMASPGGPSSWRGRCAARTRLKTRQPLARPGSPCPAATAALPTGPARPLRGRDQRQGRRADRRRLRARRSAGQAAAAQGREAARPGHPGGHGRRARGRCEFHDDGSVTLAGETLAADEVEIQATPRPGTAVAEDDGLVVVLDTALTAELRAEGDARELARAIQDLRREAGLELDDRIELWVEGLPDAVARAPAGGRRRHARRAARRRRPAGRASTRRSSSTPGPATIALRRLG